MRNPTEAEYNRPWSLVVLGLVIMEALPRDNHGLSFEPLRSELFKASGMV